MTNISTQELRTIFDLLITYLEENEHQQIELEHDYYWDIQAPERYNVYQNPGEPTEIGQLSFDWDNMQTILADPERITSYRLVWFSQILRAIGEQVWP